MTAPKERRAPSGSGGKSSVAGDSTVTQDYLKVVWAACEWGGAGASVTGLAKRMEVAPSTASENVARLVEEGLLVHEPYKAVTLSEEGRRRAMGMIRRHRILETYLVTRLGFGWDEVHAEAEELEHAQKFAQHLLDRDYTPQIGDIAPPKVDVASAKDAFEAALAHEQKVTGLIRELSVLSDSLKDFESRPLLDEFLEEQIEEESSVSDILNRLNFAGEGLGVLFIDNELAKR